MKFLLLAFITIMASSFTYAHCGGCEGSSHHEPQGSRFTRMYSGKHQKHAKKKCSLEGKKCASKKKCSVKGKKCASKKKCSVKGKSCCETKKCSLKKKKCCSGKKSHRNKHSKSSKHHHKH